MKRTGQTLLFLVCILFTVTAAYNVMADNVAVEGMAEGVACRDEKANCRAQKTRMERTPFAQTFEFVTARRKVEVRCVRSLVLIGDYACELR
jgi:hypothetical protein